MAGDLISGGGGAIASLFGSNASPKAVLNRFNRKTVRSGNRLAQDLLDDTNRLTKDQLDTFLGGQDRQQQLADQQSDVLQGVLQRRLDADPNQLLQQIGDTAFSFIDPNVVAPLARADVNRNILQRRARGLNPAAVDSTADRLRNARIASGRFLDASNQAFRALPNLFGQAFGQQQQNLLEAGNIVPLIAAGQEAVNRRGTQGILDRIRTAGAAGNIASQAIGNVNAATQGFKQPRNFADRIGEASAQNWKRA